MIRSSGRWAISTTATPAPISRADAATSDPIQPAPMTTTRPAAEIAARSRSESSSVRR